MNILFVGINYKRVVFYMEEFLKNIPPNRIIRVSRKPNLEIKLDDGTFIKSIIAEDEKLRGQRFDKCYIDDEVPAYIIDYIEHFVTMNSFLPKRERISFWEW